MNAISWTSEAVTLAESNMIKLPNADIRLRVLLRQPHDGEECGYWFTSVRAPFYHNDQRRRMIGAELDEVLLREERWRVLQRNFWFSMAESAPSDELAEAYLSQHDSI
jgi:hypothetical protein